MDNRPIGVFDSGVGGLTAVRELHKILPGEDIIYFGDTGRVPYGSRSRETLRLYAAQIISFLRGRDVKAIVVACGSISTNFAGETLTHDIPCVTVLGPTLRDASQKSENRRVGVLATAAAIRTGAYESGLRNMHPDMKVLGQACPLLVPIIENGLTDFDNQIVRLTLEMYLRPVIDFGADTIILGCTHYPLLSHIMLDMLGEKISLIDAGASAARELKRIFEQESEGKLLADRKTGNTAYYVTDSPESFASTAKLFLEQDITAQAHLVGLETLEC